MSFHEEDTSPHPHKVPIDRNQAFFDFSQDFQQKYNSHQLLCFPEENEEPPFQTSARNHSFFQNEQEGHGNSAGFLFNGFDFKEPRQQSRQLSSQIRLDCSPEIKIGKGSDRFCSFDGEDFGLNCYWGGKSNMNLMSVDAPNMKAENQISEETTMMKIEDKEKPEENAMFMSQIDQKEKDFSDNAGGRSSRGLRVLSLKVKEIVCQKKETTYKDVAETLVEGLNLKDMDMGKDEQNVKRRVYDALNVLIAADVLKKKGKNVLSDKNSTLKGKSLAFQNKIEKNNFEEIKRKIKENIKSKTEKLRDIMNKTIGLKYLINRNKNLHVKTEGNKETLNFPFIAVENQSEEQIKCVSSKNKKDFVIFFKNSFGIYGDMDILLKLNFHEKGQDLVQKTIEEAGAQNLL